MKSETTDAMTVIEGAAKTKPQIGGCNIPSSWLTPNPDDAFTTPELVAAAGHRYIEAGLSVIPIEAEMGTKAPEQRRLPRHFDAASQRRKASWKVYQIRRPRPDEIEAWVEPGTRFGLAIVAGAVSGGSSNAGLEIIDFDTAALAERWAEQVECRAPGLVDRLVRVRSPRPGLHVYYRCTEYGSSNKLACAAEAGAVATAKPKKITLIELKGEGGYCVVPPSPPGCHPRNKLYRLVDGSPDLTQIPLITPEERRLLLEEARTFNQWKEPQKAPAPKGHKTVPLILGRPGDDFNNRATWAEVLEPHGWRLNNRSGVEESWCRPGKSGGTSATINHAGHDRLHVFSSNADPFEDGHSYSKFDAYTLLNCDGDFKVAAQKLRKRGFGGQSISSAIEAAFLTRRLQSGRPIGTSAGGTA